MIKQNFSIKNTDLVYTIKTRKGTRGIRISISSDLAIVVTKSKAIPNLFIQKAVEDKLGWIIEQIEKLKNKPKKLLAHFSIKDYKLHKQDASDIVLSRCLYFNKFYNFNIKSIKIRNQKTRWGSCSSKSGLSFNYKILFLPPELRDYIIVHELAHLKEMNHSLKFWTLVSLQIPDYKRCRKDIKLY